MSKMTFLVNGNEHITFEHRSLRTTVKPANIRVATFRQQRHLEFPVMACMEGVVHAMGSDAPELVPFNILQRTVDQWNGKPIVGGHPIVGGTPVSANEPIIYERETFGLMFQARANENTRKLELVALVDPTKADTRIARDVVDRLERMMSGEVDVPPIEVSIGAFVALKNESGVFKGKPYKRVWTDLTADHLALLESGDRGACSIDMGCGVRAAQNNDGARAAQENTDMAVDKSLKERFLSLITSGFRAALSREEMTDNDLRQSLGKALHAKVPGFIDVIAVTPGQKKVVYAAAPESSMLFLETSYTLASDGTVTISDEEATEVAPRTKFEPLSAEVGTTAEQLAAASAKPPCGCGDKKAAAPTEGVNTMNRAEKIAALTAHKKAAGRYTPKFLESLTDAQVDQLILDTDALPEPKAEETTQVSTGVTAEQVSTIVTAALAAALPAALATAIPAELMGTLRSAHESAEGIKTKTIAALRALGDRCVYTEDELKAMSQPMLNKLITLAQAKPVLRASAGGVFPRALDADDEGEGDGTEETADSPEPMSKQFVAARDAAGK